MADYPLGRMPNPPDDRDRLHPFAAALPAVVTLPTYKYWPAGPVKLDQGSLGACVSHAGGNWLQGSPIRTPVTNAQCVADYWACKAIDGLPPNTEGTYDRALMKVYQDQGRLERYVWAQNMDDLIAWLLTTGGVLIGINWYRWMSDPRFVKGLGHLVNATGPLDGGHEVWLRGANRRTGLVKLVNSWGFGWASAGEAWMDFQTLERLVFSENGDACSAIERKVTAP